MLVVAITPPTWFSIAELRALAPADQVQVVELIAGREELGDVGWDACERHLAARGLGDDDRFIARHRITVEGRPPLALWTYYGDDGVVFDETGATAVRCVQQHFWSVDDADHDAIALAAALDDIGLPSEAPSGA